MVLHRIIRLLPVRTGAQLARVPPLGLTTSADMAVRSNLPHLRVDWQKVCDQYNTTAYVTRPLGTAGLVCYANRSDAEAAGTIIETLAPAGTPDQKALQPARPQERKESGAGAQ